MEPWVDPWLRRIFTVMAPARDPVATEYYMRPLPTGCVAFDSPEGRAHFESALALGGLENFFVLAPQFQTQNEPAFCGLATLAMALNALGIDPGRVWKGVWRWYDESLLGCCKALVDVEKEGIVLEEFVCLARCNGAEVDVVRVEDSVSCEALRHVVKSTCSRRDVVLAASYSRKALGQTGDGHFSPIGGFDPACDMVLLLDVARFKYPPHWIPLSLLHDAMRRTDATTGKPRGWVRLSRASVPIHDCAHCEATKAASILNRVTAGQAAKHTDIQGARHTGSSPNHRLVGVVVALFLATTAWRWARRS